MRSLIRNDDRDNGHSSTLVCGEKARAQIVALLSNPAPIDWNIVDGLLQYVDNNSTHTAAETRYTSPQDDPMGRLLLVKILSRNPPSDLLKVTLHIFPDSLSHNPSAFFTASRDATPELLADMTKHCTRNFDDTQDECPYPWILSDHISVEGAKAILEAFPKGVMKASSFLSSYNLLDYFLLAPGMVDQRMFDVTLWNKFKLVLVAAECSERRQDCTGRRRISPVHIILTRVLSRQDFWDTPQLVQHVLWLLHQLRWTDRWVFEKQSVEGKYPIHVVLSHKCTTDRSGLVAARELTRLLLEACPASAIHWNNGKLALHLAVDNGWPCHDLLLAAYPEALDTPDLGTELFPFQAAAKHHHMSASPISLDVTFELLKANPNHARSIGKDSRSVEA